MGEEKYLGGKGYQWYKHYARFMNRHLMYRVEYIGKENLPALGEPCMIVSNHQNCANDPLNLLLGLENESHPYVIARGNVFSWHKLITKFFLWLGMLPAFRLDFEGQESLSKNAETIRISGGKMLEGNRLIMYPEGTHQDKHWLGDFSFGYTRLAFETAARDGFAHNIKIVPSAHHYADYFEPGVDVVIRFGQPISLSDYYELYKTKPRTAQRQVNELVRKQIEDMMLDIRDLEHYDDIDWLRQSEVNVQRDNVHCTKALSAQLEADKRLVEGLKAKDEHFWAEVREIREEEERLGITERDIINKKSWGVTLLSILAQIILSPLWLVSLYPNIFHYNIQRLLLKTDKMYTNSWRFVVPVVVGMPFFFILTVLVCGLAWGLWWQSALWMLLAVWPLSEFALREWKWMKATWRNVRLLKVESGKRKVESLMMKRKQLFEKLKDII